MCGTVAFSIERRWLGGSFPLGLDITLPPSRMSSSVSLYSLREQTILHIDLSTFHLFLLYLCKQTHPSHRVKSSVFLSILAVRHLLPLGEGSEFCFLHKNYFFAKRGLLPSLRYAPCHLPLGGRLICHPSQIKTRSFCIRYFCPCPSHPLRGSSPKGRAYLSRKSVYGIVSSLFFFFFFFL